MSYALDRRTRRDEDRRHITPEAFFAEVFPLSCTLHEATPPVFAERRVMYTEIPLAPPADALGPMDTSVGEIRDRMDDIYRNVQGPNAVTPSGAG